MELKFKVLDLDTGKVYEPEEIDRIGFFEGKPERVTMISKLVEKAPIIYNAKLLPFTGVKDKNGEELYEGDKIGAVIIYKLQYVVGVIEFNSHNCAFGMKTQFGFFAFPDMGFFTIEKIGSIYDEKIKTP